MTEITGHCLCGRVGYAFDEDHVLWRGHCHCESCRRATGAPVATFFGVADGHWRWTGEEPRVYRSSAGVERRFCGTCGSPMTYSSVRFPGEMHFYAVTLSDPAEFRPEFHAHWQERLPWLRLDDDLHRYSGTSAAETD